MFSKSSAFALALIVFPLSTFAQQNPVDNDKILRQVFNNMSHDYSTCSAYYAVVANCFKDNKRENSEELINKYQSAGSKFFSIAEGLSEKAKIKKATVAARLEMDIGSMVSEIDKNCSNMSILLNKHSGLCKKLNDDPSSYMSELIDKEIKIQGR